MKYPTRICMLVCLILILSAVPAAAASGIMDVKCADPNGNPLSGVKVQIQHLTSGKWKDKKSDGKGLARFDKLDSGYYRVMARHEGYAPALQEFVPVKDDLQGSVSLNFLTGDSAQQLYFESQAVNQKSIDNLQQGIELLKNNQFAEAEKILQASLQLNPSSPDAYYNLSIALLQSYKWEPADHSLKMAAELAGAMAELQKSRDSSGQNPYAEMAARVNDLRAKLPALKLRVEATQAMSNKSFQQAIEMFKEALKAFPDDPEAYYNLALAQANAKLYDDAFQSIDKAIGMKPAEKAYTDLKKQIADYKQNEILMKAQGIMQEGDKLFNGGDYAGALKKYEEALPLIPGQKQAIAWGQIAKTHAQLNQPDKAVESFKKAIEISPDDPSYRKSLAQHYLNQKRYEEALNLYADPKGAGSEAVDQTLFALGQKLSGEGNAEVAQLAYEKALQANPKNAEVHYELGMHYFYNKKDANKAKQLLTKYLEIGQDKDHLSNTRNVLVVISKRK